MILNKIVLLVIYFYSCSYRLTADGNKYNKEYFDFIWTTAADTIHQAKNDIEQKLNSSFFKKPYLVFDLAKMATSHVSSVLEGHAFELKIKAKNCSFTDLGEGCKTAAENFVKIATSMRAMKKYSKIEMKIDKRALPKYNAEYFTAVDLVLQEQRKFINVISMNPCDDHIALIVREGLEELGDATYFYQTRAASTNTDMDEKQTSHKSLQNLLNHTADEVNYMKEYILDSLESTSFLYHKSVTEHLENACHFLSSALERYSYTIKKYAAQNHCYTNLIDIYIKAAENFNKSASALKVLMRSQLVQYKKYYFEAIDIILNEANHIIGISPSKEIGLVISDVLTEVGDVTFLFQEVVHDKIVKMDINVRNASKPRDINVDDN